jgi:hypothetical protein
MTDVAKVFVAALNGLRSDLTETVSRLDHVVETIKTTAGIDVTTGEVLPPDPAFSLGSRPPQDPTGETPDPAFSRGNTAPAAPELPPGRASRASRAAAPAEAPAAPESAPEPTTPAQERVEQLRKELAAAEAAAGEPAA